MSRDDSAKQVQQNPAGVQALGMSTVAPASAHVRTIIDKRTYDQVYRDALVSNHNIIYRKPENKQPAESLHVPQPGPSTSVEKQATKYTTTVYNITSHDMSNSSQKIGTLSVMTKSAQPYVLKQPIRLSQPIMEVISYQKSNPDAYAKHLQEITKSAMKKLETPKTVATNMEPPSRTETSASTMTNHKDLNDFQHRVPIVPQSNNCMQSYQQFLASQKNNQQRIQAKHERRLAPIPSLKTFAQNGEAVRISQHRSNIMVSIVNPEVSPPAPTHVYGAPMVATEQTKISVTERFQGHAGGISTNGRIPYEMNSIPGNLTEPPPAHTMVKSSPTNAPCPSSTARMSTIRPERSLIKVQDYSQDEVLNLDTKYTTTPTVRPLGTPTVPSSSPSIATLTSKACVQQEAAGSTSQVTGLGKNIPQIGSLAEAANVSSFSQHDAAGTATQSTPTMQNASQINRTPEASTISRLKQHDAGGSATQCTGTIEYKATVGAKPHTVNHTTFKATQAAIWNHLQNRNIQQLLAQLQSQQFLGQKQQSASNTATTSASDQSKFKMLDAAQNSDDAIRSLLKPNLVELNGKPSELEFKPQTLPKLNSSSKRKNAADDQDPAKKRKGGRSKVDRTSVPHLQNVPCYTLTSRLPRCRECGRSAATRSRHAKSIFCRFYAFRKLRNNELGKLEVTGFADPYLDPKEADISLWSANLQQVPVDLSIEKAKFLLGQVGYKFCELFHQEKEAHFEHLASDKTIAWKQAVQGIREMCDVCQTTLFNYHWVCSTCGFVVCIDCYKCRKRGIITTEPNTKDKDSNGWLLCTGTKEPHSQDRLMLTQIIPSNCLYKLVRQMHGICALLEIPLNCECPLSKEPRFRKIKEKFEFIYPITVNGQHHGTDEQIFYDFNGPIHAPPPSSSTKITRMVSITIKNIEQQQETERDPASLDGDANRPIECRVEFSQQFQPEEPGQCREDGVGGEETSWRAPAKHIQGENGTNTEKQSYSFERFQEEICTDGEHFDESMYKMTTVSKAVKKEQESNENEETKQAVKTEDEHSNGNGCEEKSDLITCSKQSNATNDVESRENSAENISCAMIFTKNEDSMDEETGNGAMNNCNNGEEANLSKEAVQMDTSNNDDSSELLEVVPNKPDDNGVDTTVVKKKGPSKVPFTKDPPIQAVPYSEEGRFKPSPPMDSTTLTMIVKQMVKFDKTVDIFRTFERHMASETGHQDDFEECITIKPERVRRFLLDFLDDFVYLRGQNSSDSLTNERQLLDYNRQIKDGLKFRNKGERRMQQCNSHVLYPEVAHEWLCNGKLLRLLDPLDVHNYQSFHDQWERGQPVMVSAVSSKMNMDLWIPEAFGRDFGEQVNDLINCFNGKIVRGHPMKVFWDGFECIRERLLDERDRSMMLKLKDWPPGDDFAEMMPTRFYDLMKSLPLGEYTRREGRLNLASRLSSFFVRPDLGPKMYSAYGSALHPNKGTTNLHLDISDAVNVMVYVGVPTDVPRARYNEKVLEVIDTEDCDYLTRERIRKRQELPGALWHIYHAQDADKIRALLNKIELERGGTIKPNHDPIHDQKWYLDRPMRRRLQQEYGVEGYAIVQCSGDAIFIPAGAPHQVRNLHNCIKVAEDFVSPENISYCFKLTNEFRHLSKTHSNHEDKLQIKNIIYHTVKDAVSSITNPLIMTASREADKPVM